MSGSILNTTGRTLFQLGFEISPVILTGGLAQYIPGGMLPIVALTEAANFLEGLLSGAVTLTNLDDYFAHFVPMPGGSLIDVETANFPLANQAVAANALIVQPLTISLKMICPVKSQGGYLAKLATITALQAALNQHINLGGLFTVMTPFVIYPNCVLSKLIDEGSEGSKQPQVSFRWDFIKPLITLSDAQSVQNSTMSKLTGGLPTDGSLTGAAASLGSTLTGAAAALIPSSTVLSGASIGTSASGIAGSIF